LFQKLQKIKSVGVEYNLKSIESDVVIFAKKKIAQIMSNIRDVLYLFRVIVFITNYAKLFISAINSYSLVFYWFFYSDLHWCF